MARIPDFDTWRSGYGQATVAVYLAGTETLADLFSDEELTVPLDNPQILAETLFGGISHGKWAQPVYVGASYYLTIDEIDRTGVQRLAIVTLDAEDISEAVATPAGGTVSSTIEDLLARRIDVRDYGEFKPVGDVTASTATNTATLTAAIGAVAALGGGSVVLPPGIYQISTVTVPTLVALEGQGRDATTLRSTLAGNVIVIGGDDAGLRRLTLDGQTQVGSSQGIISVDNDRVVIEDVVVKRFEDGVYLNGGNYSEWRNFTISDCVFGITFDGASTPITFNTWRGGGIELCSSSGLNLTNNGFAVEFNTFEHLFFDTNTSVASSAAFLVGAHATTFRNCKWDDNTNNLTVNDSDDADVVGVEIVDGEMNTGDVTLIGNLRNVAFRRMRLTNIDVTITTPSNDILVEDCVESGVAVGGDATSWTRNDEDDKGATFGDTTGNVATKAWSIELAPGQHVYLEGKVIGRQINAVNHGFYHISVSARRPGSLLDYDTQTGNFTAGNTVTGGTSGATAVIQADSDGGATGTLTLIDIVGEFEDNEIITDGAGGSATANGTLSEQDAALVGSVASIRAAQETDSDWAATFAANGPEIELQVTGDTGQTVEWTVQVDVMRN